MIPAHNPKNSTGVARPLITRADLVASARALLGVPFVHQGRDPEIGIDCIGLLVCAAHSCGLKPEYDYTNYQPQPNADTLRRELGRELSPIRIEDVADGDVLMLKFRHQPQHVGLAATNPAGVRTIIHTLRTESKAVNQVIEEVLHQRWSGKVVGAFTFREFIDGGGES